MKKTNRLKQNKGITLIALVITIIVLLILAGVSISAITGNDSAMQKAQEAKTASEAGDELDTIKLAVVDAVAHSNDGYVTLTNLQNAVKDLDGISATDGIEEGSFIVAGRKASYTVYTNGQVEEFKKFYLSKRTLKIELRKTEELKATVSPELENQTITWTAEGSVQIVENDTEKTSTTTEGTATLKVLGKTEGTGTITVSVEGEEPITCTITVARFPKVGDYITINPDKYVEPTEQEIAELTTDINNSDVSGANSESDTFSQNKSKLWRVLEINPETKQPTMLISDSIGGLKLKGANGYNNGIYLLDKICSTYYTVTDDIRGSEGTRSLKIEDLERHYKKDENGKTVKDDYTNQNVTPNSLGGTATYTGQYIYIPEIVVYEAGMNVYDSTKINKNLNASFQDQKYSGQYHVGTNGVTVTQTSYYKNGGLNNIYNGEKYNNENIYFTLFNNSGYSWIASRGVTCESKRCFFGLWWTRADALSCTYLSYTTPPNYTLEGYKYGVRPVLTLKSNITTTYIRPYNTNSPNNVFYVFSIGD